MSRPLDAFDFMVELASWPDSDRQLLQSMRDARRATLPPIPRFRAAEPFWVNNEFTELISAAALSLPETPLQLSEVPAVTGVVVFDGLVNMNDEMKPDDEPRDHSVAVYWDSIYTNKDSSDSPYGLVPAGATVLTLFDFQPLHSPATLGLRYVPAFGCGCPVGREPLTGNRLVSVMRTFWRLCGQRVASTRSEIAPRSSARRAIRLGIDHIPEVSIVTLRRPAGRPREDFDGPGFVDWSHRWIVGGHWRNQWVPSKQDHEPRWIAPYVKGPDDKPLIADRVYQLVR